MDSSMQSIVELAEIICDHFDKVTLGNAVHLAEKINDAGYIKLTNLVPSNPDMMTFEERHNLIPSGAMGVTLFPPTTKYPDVPLSGFPSAQRLLPQTCWTDPNNTTVPENLAAQNASGWTVTERMSNVMTEYIDNEIITYDSLVIGAKLHVPTGSHVKASPMATIGKLVSRGWLESTVLNGTHAYRITPRGKLWLESGWGLPTNPVA